MLCTPLVTHRSQLKVCYVLDYVHTLGWLLKSLDYKGIFYYKKLETMKYRVTPCRIFPVRYLSWFYSFSFRWMRRGSCEWFARGSQAQLVPSAFVPHLETPSEISRPSRPTSIVPLSLDMRRCLGCFVGGGSRRTLQVCYGSKSKFKIQIPPPPSESLVDHLSCFTVGILVLNLRSAQNFFGFTKIWSESCDK